MHQLITLTDRMKCGITGTIIDKENAEVTRTIPRSRADLAALAGVLLAVNSALLVSANQLGNVSNALQIGLLFEVFIQAIRCAQENLFHFAGVWFVLGIVGIVGSDGHQRGDWFHALVAVVSVANLDGVWHPAVAHESLAVCLALWATASDVTLGRQGCVGGQDC